MSHPEGNMISVIIPVYNGGEQFRRCLDAIHSADPPPDEVIVVADGESDGSFRLAERLGYTTIVLDGPQGPAFARNRGVEAASGDILFFIDADVAVNSNVVDIVASAFYRYSDIAAMIGSYDDDPTETNFLSQFKNLIHHYVHQTSREEASTFWGACGAIRKSVFQEVRGFDESYRNPCIEDIELGYRVVEHGYAIRLEKTLQVKHMKRWTITSMLKADILYRALPWSELIINRGRIINDLNLTVKSRICVILVLLLPLSALLVPFSDFWTGGGAALILSCILYLFNRDVYHFFYEKRGRMFALKSIPWHWLYYGYSGLSFAYVMLKTKLSRAFGV